MRRAAPLSVLLLLSFSGCKDSDPPSSPSSSSSAGSAANALGALSKTPLTGADVEKYLAFFPVYKKSTRKREDLRVAAAAQGLSYEDATILMTRVNAAYYTLLGVPQAPQLGGSPADVEVVRPFKERIDAMMKAR
jgi:hypothetical protein